MVSNNSGSIKNAKKIVSKTAQVSAQASALVSKNNSNNSSLVRKTVKGVSNDAKNPQYYTQSIGASLAKKKTVKAGLISDILTKPGNKFAHNPRLKQMNSTKTFTKIAKTSKVKPATNSSTNVGRSESRGDQQYQSANTIKIDINVDEPSQQIMKKKRQPSQRS